MRRTRNAVIALALAASGCSLLLDPDRDAIVPDRDGGVDAGLDAGDGGLDAGDAGDDAGGDACIPRREDCVNGFDDDCDQLVDCFDFDCRGVGRCCRTGAGIEEMCLQSTSELRLIPAEAVGDVQFSDTDCDAQTSTTQFGSQGRTRALVTNECQPINFGMRFEATFRIEILCSGETCDYAGLSFTPVQTLTEGSALPSELRVVIRANGSARVERGGAVMHDAEGAEASRPPGTFRTVTPITVTIDLDPGPDASGRDVLYATIDLRQDGSTVDLGILPRTAVMPLSDLRCLRPAGPEVGLFAAIEGSGRDVDVVGPIVLTERECSNPSQFRIQQGIQTSTIAASAPGGIGAPALVNYCRTGCTSSPRVQWDLWVDASDVQRLDESFRFVDFGVFGYAFDREPLPSGEFGDDWVTRGGPGSLGSMWPIPPSSREPTLLPVYDDGATTRVSFLWYAFAKRKSERSEVYEIHGGQVFRDPLQIPGTPAIVLAPDGTDCVSVRDPLLVAHHAPLSGTGFRVDGAWLFFTCERVGAPRSIGAVRLDDELNVVPGTMRSDVVTRSVGAYASRGVFAPEGFSEPRASETSIRLWFLTRDERGSVRLSFAQGRGPSSSTELPALAPYPANPILDGSSDILGGDCTGSTCTLTGLSVTPSFIERGDYQFVLTRSRLTPTGAVHELVPLLQPAPAD